MKNFQSGLDTSQCQRLLKSWSTCNLWEHTCLVYINKYEKQSFEGKYASFKNIKFSGGN